MRLYSATDEELSAEIDRRANIRWEARPELAEKPLRRVQTEGQTEG